MIPTGKPNQGQSDEVRELREQCENLQRQLEEAESVLSAIRRGEVDALVVSTDQDDRVFTLRNADHTYRVMVETMQEGAATALPDGTILYANNRLAEMLDFRLEQLIGSSFVDLLEPEARPVMKQWLSRARSEIARDEFHLVQSGGTIIPVQISTAPLALEGLEAICIVVTDISETRAFQLINEQLQGEVERRGQINEELEQRVRERTEDLRRLAGHAEAVREEEGRRIAQEIHDQIGGALTALKIDLSLIRRALGDDHSDLSARFDSVNLLLTEIVKDVRRISKDLRPPIIDQLGLSAAIQHHLSEYEERTGIKCKLELHGLDPVKSADAIPIFRIVQESLTNVAKHASATEVVVRTYVDKNEYCLEISDNGCGIQQNHGHEATVGLVGMKERAVRMGGRLRIAELESGGTIVRLTIPLDSIPMRQPFY